jgi:hypothetical protein
MYDIFFLSYDEVNAEENYTNLKERFPALKRVHGVKGILNAHKECARKSFTKYFFVVDGDNEVLEDFDFTYENDLDEEHVLVWRSENAVNGLIYGYGGIKLLPKKLLLNMPEMVVDMTTSLSTKFKIIPELASITRFNTSPFNAWRGGFRECVKLSSKMIDRQKDDETEERLRIWCAEGVNKEWGNFTIRGAQSGKLYGLMNKNNKDALKLINDFNWLHNKFLEDTRDIKE